ncbi:hypothetical protein [Janthinobacterium sp. 35]|uniref:hypothetical protein n=1 Tax=Janthinobacterium sp. 35 TaxID=2035210 RepID=UPI001179DEDB|nr:hypothetical protein [Janthinobacterium sp. 35]
MKWWKILLTQLRIRMNGIATVAGTTLTAKDIVSAYVVTHNGRKICIVISTVDGVVESYPYTPELEKGVLQALKIDKLDEQDFSIDYLINFYNKNERLISAMTPFLEKNNSHTPK